MRNYVKACDSSQAIELVQEEAAESKWLECVLFKGSSHYGYMKIWFACPRMNSKQVQNQLILTTTQRTRLNSDHNNYKNWFLVWSSKKHVSYLQEWGIAANCSYNERINQVGAGEGDSRRNWTPIRKGKN